MKRLFAFSLVAVCLASVSGCGGPDTLVRELVINLNQVADLIEKRAPKERIQLALDRAYSTLEKLNNQKLSKEQQEALFKKHEDELNKVTERLKEVQTRRKLEVGDDFPQVVVEDFIKK